MLPRSKADAERAKKESPISGSLHKIEKKNLLLFAGITNGRRSLLPKPHVAVARHKFKCQLPKHKSETGNE